MIASRRAHLNFLEESLQESDELKPKVVSFWINVCIYSSSDWEKELELSLKQDSSSWQKRLGRENEVSSELFIILIKLCISSEHQSLLVKKWRLRNRVYKIISKDSEEIKNLEIKSIVNKKYNNNNVIEGEKRIEDAGGEAE